MMIPYGAFNKKKEPTEEEKKAEEEKKRLAEERDKQLKIERPHICHWCGQEGAYIGCTKIECSNPKCRRFVPFEWPVKEDDNGCNE